RHRPTPRVGRLSLVGGRRSAGRAGFLLVGGSADDIDVDLAAAADDVIEHGPEEQVAPARALGLADDDLGDVMLLGVVDHFIGDALTGERDGLAPEVLGEANSPFDAPPIPGWEGS